MPACLLCEAEIEDVKQSSLPVAIIPFSCFNTCGLCMNEYIIATVILK